MHNTEEEKNVDFEEKLQNKNSCKIKMLIIASIRILQRNRANKCNQKGTDHTL